MSEVVSGWGLVQATGCGRPAADRAFGEGALATSEVDRAAGYHRRGGARLAALVGPEVDLGPWLAPRLARRMSPPSRHAVVAASIALAQAGLALEEPSATAVVTSTSYGPSSYTEELLRQISDSPQSASPFLFTEAVANAPAAQIALLLKAQGPNITVTQREAGPLLALARGVGEVRRSRAERAVVAATDEMNTLLHAVLDRFGVLAGSRGGDERARPFDRERRGFLAGEGALAVLIEKAEAVLDRGGRPLATVRADAAGFDPSAGVAGYGEEGEALGERLAEGLRRQGVDLRDGHGGIDAIVSGAGGSRQGDRAEAALLRGAFGRDLGRPVFAPNGYAGQHGAVPLAFALWLLEGGVPAPTANFAAPDPKLGLVPWQGGPWQTPRRVLVSAPAVGGAAAFLVLDRWEAGLG